MPDSSLRSRMTGKYLLPFCRKLFTCLLTLTPFVSSADTLAKAKRLTHFYSVALLLEKWFACHHSFPYFFILVFPTAFYDRSRMTGKYLMPLCKNRFFCFCSRLPLSAANAATFPVFGDSLRFIFFSSSPKSHSIPHRNAIHSCRHS